MTILFNSRCARRPLSPMEKGTLKICIFKLGGAIFLKILNTNFRRLLPLFQISDLGIINQGIRLYLFD